MICSQRCDQIVKTDINAFVDTPIKDAEKAAACTAQVLRAILCT